MKSVSKLSLLAFAIVLITTFIAPAYVTAQASSCTCNDIPFLINRLNAINAGIDAALQFEQTGNVGASTNEIAPAPNPTRATYQEILNRDVSAATLSVQNGAGATGSVACAAELQNQFDQVTRSIPGGVRTMREFSLSLRTAYTSLAADILRRLSSMPRSCRPGDWFGFIRAVETQQFESTVTVPSRGQISLGSEQTTRDNTTRIGNIWLSGKSAQSLSSWTAGGNMTFTSSSGTRTRCEGGLKGALPQNQTVTNTLNRNFGKAGSANPPLDINISESDGGGSRFAVGFEMPTINATMSGTETNTSSGGCPGSDFNRTNSVSGVSLELASHSVIAKVPYFRGDPERVSGTDVIDLTPPNLSTNVTASHKIRVSVHLYKLRR